MLPFKLVDLFVVRYIDIRYQLDIVRDIDFFNVLTYCNFPNFG